MPATFWVWRTTPFVMTIPAASRMPRAHDCTEWPRCDALAQPLAERGPLVRLSAASARIRSASAPGSQRAKRCSASEELVEDRVRGEHRQHAAAAS